MKRRSVVLITIILLAISIVGCMNAKTTVSDGSLYYDRKLGTGIYPPAGWGIFSMNNALVDGVSFYPTEKGNARFFITSRTILTESIGALGTENEETVSLADHVTKYRIKRKKRPECRILRDKREKLNSFPAHVIEIAYMHEGMTPAEDKSYLFKYHGRYYVVGYWVFRDRDYDKNIAILEGILGTFRLDR